MSGFINQLLTLAAFLLSFLEVYKNQEATQNTQDAFGINVLYSHHIRLLHLTANCNFCLSSLGK